MNLKKITFSFPTDAWEGIMMANSQNYQETVTRFSEDGVRSQVENPVSRESQAIENIIKTISAPWKQLKMQEAIVATQEAARLEVEAREAEVRAATEVEITEITEEA